MCVTCVLCGRHLECMCLCGSVCTVDASAGYDVQDEWLCVSLLMDLSKRYRDVVVEVVRAMK